MTRRAWLKAIEAEPKAIWIVKPPASSCGRGIRVINKATASTVSKTKKCLVQVSNGVVSRRVPVVLMVYGMYTLK